MRRLSVVCSAAVWCGTAVLAQGTAAQPAPMSYVRLAMHARAKDSVAAAMAEWRAWAAREPAAPAPRFALGMLARFDQRYTDALRWLDSAAGVAAAPVWRVAAARERATVMAIRGEYADLPQFLSIALSDSANIPLAEWAESRYLGLAIRRKTGGPFSREALDSILVMTTPDDSVLRAKIGCVQSQFDPEHMIELAEAAIALANAAGAPSIAANCELVIGSRFANSYDRRWRAWLMRAAASARAAHDDPTLAAALQWHGYTLSTFGSVRAARELLSESIRIAQRVEDRNVEAWALLGIAKSAQMIGDAATSSSATRRARTLFEVTGDRYGLTEARMMQANAMVQLGDLANAEVVAREARTLGDSLRQPTLIFGALNMLSDVAMRSGRFDAASAIVDTTEPVALGISKAYATQINKYRGMVALHRGQTSDAIRRMLEVKSQYVPAQQLFRYAVNAPLAYAWLQQRDTLKAAQTLLEANDNLDAVRSLIAAEGMRRVVAAPDEWGGQLAYLDNVLAALVTSPRWLPTAFAAAERTRSRALQKGSFGVEFEDTSSSVTEARRRVSARSTVLRDVQQALKPNTALLVYAGGASTARTSLMVVTRGRTWGLTLAPIDSLDRAIVRWLALLENGERGVGAGRQVAAAVLAGALRQLPQEITRLIVVPQASLYRVPFQALPFGGGVLGDRVVVTVAPSVSLAMTYAAEPRAPIPAHVLALGAGDTQVANAQPQSLEISVDRSVRGNPLAPLHAAADEARTAAAWGTGSLALTGSAASEAAFKHESHGEFTILHAAAHALTSDQALGANYLILRPDSTEDGYVSGGELAAMSTNLSMVVLSGCRTTGDFGSRGDAIDGLVAPLLARGVRTVVASHWAVSDRWTSVLMQRFYGFLAQGLPTADAMNRAQESLRRAGVPARFWAAFSVIGDGDLTFTARPIAGR
jgi:tetratricopeptide (TPR) repeat protein